MSDSITNALSRAQEHSPFLALLIEREPELVEIIKTGDFDAALNAALGVDESDVALKLRQQRKGVALVTAIADLSGAWDLAKVTRALSDFADARARHSSCSRHRGARAGRGGEGLYGYRSGQTWWARAQL